LYFLFIIAQLTAWGQNGQTKTDKALETVKTTIALTPKVIEEDWEWTYEFESFDKAKQTVAIRETYRENGEIQTERISPLKLTDLKAIKIIEAQEDLNLNFECTCELYFNKRFEQKVIFYQEGAEYETPSMYSLPFKTTQDCKQMKKALRRLKRLLK